jgi:hypothetical protein
MACPFYYMRPDEIWSYSTGASASAVGTDTDYSASWAIDQRIGRPYRSNAATFSLTIQATCGEVGMVAVVNHNLQPSYVVTLLSTSLTVPAGTPPDGIPDNLWLVRTPANTTTLVLASTQSNSTNPVVGEVLAGKYRTLARGLKIADTEFEDRAYASDPQAEFSSINPYDKGLADQTITGSVTVSSSEFDDLRGWFRAQRGWSKPSVAVINGAALAVKLVSFRYKKIDESLYDVRLAFLEYPRSRW